MVMARDAAQLLRAVAEFLAVDASSVRRETPLGLASSLARARLDAVLRRELGITCAAVYSARNYGELEAAVAGDSADRSPEMGAEQGADDPAPVPGSEPAFALPAGVQCGVDIVDVAELPRADDFWEHDFYRHGFSAAEIAYCSTQAQPLEHFAARWAAKEAVRKCCARYVGAEPNELEVLRGADGAPGIRWRGAPLPIALSLSHTPTAAVAVAIAVARPTPSEPQRSSPAAPGAVSAPAPSGSRGGGALPWAVLTATAAAAAWALLRTFGAA
jgi:holo-[acyl-carrier protein] synthase